MSLSLSLSLFLFLSLSVSYSFSLGRRGKRRGSGGRKERVGGVGRDMKISNMLAKYTHTHRILLSYSLLQPKLWS